MRSHGGSTHNRHTIWQRYWSIIFCLASVRIPFTHDVHRTMCRGSRPVMNEKRHRQ